MDFMIIVCVRVYEGDRKAEAEVDSRLLIPFRQCLRWNCDDQSSSTDKHRPNQYDVVVTDVNKVSVTTNLLFHCFCSCYTTPNSVECFPIAWGQLVKIKFSPTAMSRATMDTSLSPRSVVW